MCAKKRKKGKKRGASVLARHPHIKTGGGGYLDWDRAGGREKVAYAKYVKTQLEGMSD